MTMASQSTVDAVRDAVVDAYYSDRVRAGAGARTRAQAAQSIVTIFAGALVATFTLSSLADRPIITRVVGCAAVGLWLGAAVLYVRAVGTPVQRPPGLTEVGSEPSDLIKAVVEIADNESKSIDRRQVFANLVSVLALVATLATLVLALFVHPNPPYVRGSVDLTSAGQQAVASMCGVSVTRLDGDVLTTSVDSPFVAVRVRSCGAIRNAVIRVPQSQVASISTEEE